MQQGGVVLSLVRPSRAVSIPRVADVRARLDGSRWTCRAGATASHILWCDAASGVTMLCGDGGAEREWADPLEALRWMAGAPIGRCGTVDRVSFLRSGPMVRAIAAKLGR